MTSKLKEVGQNSKVSVIIPTYNRSTLLKKAIKSALNQTYPVYEVLVCDDGSTDDSKKLVSKIKDKRVWWIDGKHTGLPAIPRNKGLKIAKGDWVAMLDSDDIWLPKKNGLQLSFAKKSGYQAVCSNAYRVINGKKKGMLIDHSKNKISFFEQLKDNHIICSSVIFHKSLLKKVQGFPDAKYLKAIEDFAFWLRITTCTHFGYIDEPLILYRDEPKESIRNQFSLNDTFSKQRNRAIKNYIIWYLSSFIKNR